MGRAVPIADLVILRQLLFQREAIERRPFAVDDRLFLEIAAAAQNRYGPCGVSCSRSSSRWSGPLSAQPPKPTSAM